MVKKAADKVVAINGEDVKEEAIVAKKQNLKIVLKEEDYENPINDDEWREIYKKKELFYEGIQIYTVSQNFLTVIKSNGESEHFNVDGVYAIIQSFAN